jgi:peptidoglycan/LPS O-acetylase OafA/YrhL
MLRSVSSKAAATLKSLMYAPAKHGGDYRPDVDGLRAVAVLAVVVFHAFPNRLSGGFVGVDVFFVISGFLITGIIYKGLRTEKFSFLDFWARRIRRIFPALLTVIVACEFQHYSELIFLRYSDYFSAA